MNAWLCNNHKQGHKQNRKVPRHEYEVKGTTHKVWSKSYHRTNKVLEVPGVYILPSDITNFPINSVISNVLKKNSSERSIT